ncbi:hypothetical protein RPE78_09120 [Thioclava litoralis]|uniref:Uncharacterized protein n=1 Tax=Thioclava litoralis TaxID=3076557 RepID=A0ABZ1DVT4_9RHOB|nr:hypothetical protein RPE78_09120 [Thioclava sp. FTW29]
MKAARPTKTAIQRAISACREEGMAADVVEILPDGTIRISQAASRPAATRQQDDNRKPLQW